MVGSEKEFDRLFRIRRTVMQMLRDRDYLVTDSEINMSINDFRLEYSDNVKKIRDDLFVNKAKKHNTSDQIYVFFNGEPKVGVDTIKTYTNRMKSENVVRAILIVKPKLTVYARECIAKIFSKFHLEVFQESELRVNVMDHVLVPEQKLLTDSEKKTLLERYTVKETQLPRIQVTDSVARYLGMTRGQVVRISRHSETSGKCIAYRYVV